MNKIAVILLKLLLASAVVWALVHYAVVDLSALRVAITPAVLAVVICLLTTMYIMSAFRWYLLLKCQFVNVTVGSAIGVTFLTLFAGTFLPGGLLSGDAVRIAYVSKSLASQRTAAVLSIFIDRLLGMYAMLLVVCAVALLDLPGIMRNAPLQLLATIAATFCICIPVVVYVLFGILNEGRHRLQRVEKMLPSGFISNVFQKVVKGLKLYQHVPGVVSVALGISILIFILGIVCVMILGHSIELGTLGPADFGFAAPWASLANLLPVTPGGLGVGEAAFDRICHWREVRQTAAAYGTIFLAYRIIAAIATLPGLIVYAAVSWDS